MTHEAAHMIYAIALYSGAVAVVVWAWVSIRQKRKEAAEQAKKPKLGSLAVIDMYNERMYSIYPQGADVHPKQLAVEIEITTKMCEIQELQATLPTMPDREEGDPYRRLDYI